MKTDRQVTILSSMIQCLVNISESSDYHAPYHSSDISNEIETMVDNGTLTEKQGSELDTKMQSLLNFVLKVK